MGSCSLKSNRGSFLPGASRRCAAAALHRRVKYELPMHTTSKPGTCSPPKAHGAIPEPTSISWGGVFTLTLRKWKFRCAQGASCSAQLGFVRYCSAGEGRVQAMPRVAVESFFLENGFPHHCVSSFCSHALSVQD